MAAIYGHGFDLLSILIFSSLNSTAQTMGQRPTPPLSPRAPSPPPMIHRCRRLSVGCCVPPSSGGHLRPRVSPSLYFLMWLKSMPPRQAPTPVSANPPPGNCNGLTGSRGTMRWGHGGCIHGDTLAKPLGVGRAAAAHLVVVVCCVCWYFMLENNHIQKRDTLARAPSRPPKMC